jgi:iron uptake system EfeUOB component EfeO/EfeM
MAKQDRLARREMRTFKKMEEARRKGKTKRAGKLYDKLLKRQTKSIKGGVNVNYGSGSYTFRKGGAVGPNNVL